MGERLVQVRVNSGLSARKFAQSIGVDPSQYLKTEKGQMELPSAKVKEVASVYGIDAGWLLFGADTKNEERKTLTDADFVTVPVYGENGAQAGSPGIVADGGTHPTEWRKIARSMFDDCEGILPVYGNSMSPGYPPGSELAIAKDRRDFFEWGEVYVLEVRGSSRPLFKRVQPSNKEGHIRLVSDNHMVYTEGPLKGEFYYPPIDFPLEQLKDDGKWTVLGDQKRRTNKAILLREIRERQYA